MDPERRDAYKTAILSFLSDCNELEHPAAMLKNAIWSLHMVCRLESI